MNYFITLIIILISSSAWSRSNTKENTFDINKDGKTDLIEIVEDNRTIEIREDVNFDGTYDRKTSFFHTPEAKYFKIIEETAGKTRPRRRSSYWHDKKDLRTYSLVQLDRNNDGKWDTQYKRSSERFQKREDCNEATPGLGLINELAKFSFDVASQADEYLETKWGHRIHKSCLGNDQKDWFLAQTEQAITVGLSCLESLSKKGGKGAARNLTLLNSLLSRQNAQIICNETDYNWGNGTVAHATSSGSDDKEFLKHPGISLNPKYLKDYKSQGDKGSLEFRRTIFHEQLHNLGYLHNHDIEYPYACETCCFPENDSSEITIAACKVCSGSYESNTDIAYIRDITSYGEAKYDSSHAASATIAHLKENPGSLDGMSYLALNLSGVFDPIGSHLAEKIVLEAKNLSTEQRQVLERAQEYQDSTLFKQYESSSKIVASAYYDSYSSGDPLAALKQIEAHSSTIKSQLNNNSTSAANEEYVREGIKGSLKKLIFDVWLNDYSGKYTDEKSKTELNALAYKLFNELYPKQ